VPDDQQSLRDLSLDEFIRLKESDKKHEKLGKDYDTLYDWYKASEAEIKSVKEENASLKSQIADLETKNKKAQSFAGKCAVREKNAQQSAANTDKLLDVHRLFLENQQAQQARNDGPQATQAGPSNAPVEETRSKRSRSHQEEHQEEPPRSHRSARPFDESRDSDRPSERR
jgi:hypothetical protein